MAQRISDLPALAALEKEDMFEVTKYSEKKSYSVTASVVNNFVKKNNNGAFNGNTSDSLESLFAPDKIGVWRWMSSGDAGPNGLTSGIVEVLSGVGPNDNPDDYIQRFSFGSYVYQRTCIDNSISAWASLTNQNGCRIQYDVTSDTDVTFPVPFARIPSVVCIPVAATSGKIVNVINVTGVSATGFHVTRYSSDAEASEVKEVVETVKETTTDDQTGKETSKTTTTTTTTTERGAWTEGSFSYYWIALVEEG